MYNKQPLDDLQNIRHMMEKSSRFISLSGWSGISAGICALIGAWLSYDYIYKGKEFLIDPAVAIVQAISNDYTIILNTWLFWIAAGTFIAAFLSAFFFTWIRSRRQGIPIWGNTAKRLIWNVSVPLIAGGIFLFRMLQFDLEELFAPGCLIFYGIALLNASKYTLKEIRYLGYTQLLTGLINLWFVGYGLYFWAFGFGILHIVYGIYMWFKYDRRDN